MKKILHITLALALVFGMGGCDFLEFLGSSLEEQDLGVNFDPESGEVSFNINGDKKEDQVIQNADLPQGWDSVIVIYPESEVVDSVTTISKGQTSSALTLLAGDSLSSVRDFYRGVLVAGGYTLGESSGVQINATKENKNLTIDLALKGEQTQIKMTLEY